MSNTADSIKHSTKKSRIKESVISVRLLEYLLLFSILTLTWNGLQDNFTNLTYLFIVIYAFFLRSKIHRSVKLKYLRPLIASIIVSTFVAILLGQDKQENLNLLENQYFSSTRIITSQISIYSPGVDLIPAFKWCVALVSLPFVVQVLKRTNLLLLKRATNVWIYGLMINIVVQIMQFFQLTNTGILTNLHLNLSNSRFPGLASHPNALAISVCLTIPLVFMPLISMPKIKRIIVVGMMIFSIYITESRAGLIVLALTLSSIIILTKDFGKIQISKLIIVIMVIAFAFGLGFLAKIISLTRLSNQNTSAKASNSERLQLLEYGWNAFLDYPITGAGAVNLKVSHNIFLQVLSSIGIVGFICFLVFMIQLITIKADTLFYEKLPLIVFLLFGIFNNSLSDFYLYFPIGFAYSLSLPQLNKNGPTSQTLIVSKYS